MLFRFEISGMESLAKENFHGIPPLQGTVKPKKMRILIHNFSNMIV